MTRATGRQQSCRIASPVTSQEPVFLSSPGRGSVSRVPRSCFVFDYDSRCVQCPSRTALGSSLAIGSKSLRRNSDTTAAGDRSAETSEVLTLARSIADCVGESIEQKNRGSQEPGAVWVSC